MRQSLTLALTHTSTRKAFGKSIADQPMMTNVLAGSYPDVFAAGASYSGTAFGCFAGSTSPFRTHTRPKKISASSPRSSTRSSA